ncbi:MAG: glycoside hydrolase family 66 protein [Prolixibacteraceae bacterium]
MRNSINLIFFLFVLILVSCVKPNEEPEIVEFPVNESTPAFQNLKIETDKAVYIPGEKVVFTITGNSIPDNSMVKYTCLGEGIEEHQFNANSWTWNPPSDDFKGYLIEITNDQTVYASIAVDVSSSWTKFPRYGFLSKYGALSDEDISGVISNLNRHHINGIQFYDWHNKHHRPLPVNGDVPLSKWKDIINNDVYFSTVENYISLAHQHGMKTMFYNLIFGAWKNAEADGVNKEWYVFTDNTHTNRDFHPLPSPPFLSNLYLLDPSNPEWQNYLLEQDRIVYSHLNFDGFHMDQLGDRGTRYKYDGSNLKLSETFPSFIEAEKTDQSLKYSVMNAVNQYGQEGIAASSTDFLYSEIWNPFNSYADLASIIKQNNALSNNTKNTILAAYVNYDLADQQGYFNTASVLMTNAVIFAFGGAHLELGEHMLGKEYFPNNNLKMKTDLQTALVTYYDFMVAYQNLLRDGGSFNTPELSSVDNKMELAKWPAANGYVAVFGKQLDNKQVIHLINFKNSTTDQWRDNQGVQSIPAMIKNSQLDITSTEIIKKLWIASPDVIGGASRSLAFKQEGDHVYFTLPELKYWTMIVLEN